jgi:Flp pilus assembly protein TadG
VTATGDITLRRARRGLERSEGQATLEFVLVLPFIVTLVFVLIQMGLTFNTYIRVTDAAGAAARAAAVARFDGVADPCDAARAAVSSDLRQNVSCTYPSGATPGNPVQVTVTHDWRIELPLLPLSDNGILQGSATERLE